MRQIRRFSTAAAYLIQPPVVPDFSKGGVLTIILELLKNVIGGVLSRLAYMIRTINRPSELFCDPKGHCLGGRARMLCAQNVALGKGTDFVGAQSSPKFR